ncbi:MAG: c-type cytochrome [Casimicrobiaceae bacterium]
MKSPLRQIACAFTCTTLFATGSAHAQYAMPQQPVTTRQLVSQVCAACHGIDGNSARADVPSLARQVHAYLEGQLHAFAAQGEQRVSGVMGAIAVNLSSDEMKRVATYFSRQTPRPVALAEAPLAQKGEIIFFEGLPAKGVASCASCHGTRAEGLPNLFPRLAGQHKQYLAEQLRRFRVGTRTTDPDAMMRRLAAQLSDHDIDAVSQYVALMP